MCQYKRKSIDSRQNCNDEGVLYEIAVMTELSSELQSRRNFVWNAVTIEFSMQFQRRLCFERNCGDDEHCVRSATIKAPYATLLRE